MPAEPEYVSRDNRRTVRSSDGFTAVFTAFSGEICMGGNRDVDGEIDEAVFWKLAKNSLYLIWVIGRGKWDLT